MCTFFNLFCTKSLDKWWIDRVNVISVSALLHVSVWAVWREMTVTSHTFHPHLSLTRPLTRYSWVSRRRLCAHWSWQGGGASRVFGWSDPGWRLGREETGRGRYRPSMRRNAKRLSPGREVHTYAYTQNKCTWALEKKYLHVYWNIIRVSDVNSGQKCRYKACLEI